MANNEGALVIVNLANPGLDASGGVALGTIVGREGFRNLSTHVPRATAKRSAFRRHSVMIRSLAIIIAAIKLSQPDISHTQAERYAQVLQREAKEHDFDPLTGVAIVHRESHWMSGVISADGEDYGLAQIRARYVGACRQDPDPVHAPSEACRLVQQSLLQGEYNLRVMAGLITRNRQLCKEKTGSARFEQWLASYEGRNYPSRDRWCHATEETRQVIRYRHWLISKVVTPQRKRTASSGKATAKRDGGTVVKRRGGAVPRKGKPAAPRKPTGRKGQPSKRRTK